ncbi:MAG: GTP 3',8-cyclase MoaA [Ardenticatenia bacterium]|nr:GTP 3',8-cyclase MoaA [Ardenticatenia bacterium]
MAVRFVDLEDRQGKTSLFDRYGRRIHYLRVSLIDQCNLRCVYCMPVRGNHFTPKAEWLTPEEIETIVRAAVSVGFDKVRLTGGEPTLRPDLLEIVERLAGIEGIRTLAMTTNGLLLPKLAHPLKQAGLTRVNIHLDTVKKPSLNRIMLYTRFEKVWAGILAAEEAGLLPIKLNAVVLRGYNDEDVADLAALTLDHPWHVRFIEAMPLGPQATVALERFVSNAETKARIEERFGPLEPAFDGQLVGEARMYRIPDAAGFIGFISPVSEPYCDSCNRLRLTADGKMRLCLLTDHELDFRQALQEGGQEALQALFARAVRAKPVGHQLRSGVYPLIRSMSQIGG